MNAQLRAAYLDYVNNYLTVKVWAEHNGLTTEQGEIIIAIGRALHEEHCALSCIATCN